VELRYLAALGARVCLAALGGLFWIAPAPRRGGNLLSQDHYFLWQSYSPPPFCPNLADLILRSGNLSMVHQKGLHSLLLPLLSPLQAAQTYADPALILVGV